MYVCACVSVCGGCVSVCVCVFMVWRLRKTVREYENG